MVTRIAGFIGSRLAEALIVEGRSVIGVNSSKDYYPKSTTLQNMKAVRRISGLDFEEADISAIARYLGYEPRVSLNGGLSKRVEWVLDRGGRCARSA